MSDHSEKKPQDISGLEAIGKLKAAGVQLTASLNTSGMSPEEAFRAQDAFVKGGNGNERPTTPDGNYLPANLPPAGRSR